VSKALFSLKLPSLIKALVLTALYASNAFGDEGAMIKKVTVSTTFHQAQCGTNISFEYSDGKYLFSIEKGQYTGNQKITYTETVQLTEAEWKALLAVIDKNDLLHWQPITGAVKRAEMSTGFSIVGEKSIEYSFDSPPDNMQPVYALASYMDALADQKFGLHYAEDLAKFSWNGLYGYMNEIGVVIIKPRFFKAEDFMNGKARVCFLVRRLIFFHREQWVWIDTRGEVIKGQ